MKGTARSIRSGAMGAMALFAAAAGCTTAGSAADARGAPMEQLVAPGAARATDDPPPVDKVEAGPVAVVELFTSEGCSSCPPADDLLRELAGEGGAADPRVITLSFHVDYWNELGWPDPFSSAESTARQRAYARALGERGMYTPQMVIGGRRGFVGSNRREARSTLEEALARPATARVALRADARGGAAEVEARYAVDGAPADAVLTVALVEDGVVSRVLRGENAGRTLRHESVVRAFTSVRLAGDAGAKVRSGAVTLPAPPPSGPGRRSVIGYVQRLNLEVLGAARAPIE